MWWRLAWLCAAAALAVAHADAGALAPTRSDLVDVLKRNLRRDNDDYAHEQRQSHPAPRNSTRDRGPYRRAGRELSWEVDSDETTRPSAAPATASASAPASATAPSPASAPRGEDMLLRSRFLHVKRNISRLQNKINVPHARVIHNNTTRVKTLNEIQVDKFKQFIKKNAGLLARGREGEPGELKRNSKKGVLRNAPVAPTSQRAAEAQEAGTLPDPELLDMAPARGGRIHRLRAKGRLCQRHVLLPEGPKYDSNGRWYVPEHRLVARHRYDVTARPRLLLPRCCNCCKKSVLGCE